MGLLFLGSAGIKLLLLFSFFFFLLLWFLLFCWFSFRFCFLLLIAFSREFCKLLRVEFSHFCAENLSQDSLSIGLVDHRGEPPVHVGEASSEGRVQHLFIETKECAGYRDIGQCHPLSPM